ncbi:MAG: 50S ribosomal protein L44e [Candidatus Altiarchaeota archaeon]
MKFPSIIRTNCPSCKSHQEHEVSLNRKGKERTINRGRRKYEAVKKGYKGSPRCPKKTVFKIGKRSVMVLKCKACGKKHQKVHVARTKKPVEVE